MNDTANPCLMCEIEQAHETARVFGDPLWAAGMERKSPTTACMHHVAYTFDDLDGLLDRYVLLRDQGITPAVSIAHGVTTSMYYRDPDGNSTWSASVTWSVGSREWAAPASAVS